MKNKNVVTSNPVLTRFEWDPAKASSNIRKHGISFETAARAFLDPHALFANRIASKMEKRDGSYSVLSTKICC